MIITLTVPSLVLIAGPSGSGKSTFARKHFKSTEVLSSDFFRGLLADDENDQSVSKDAFEVLHWIAAKRLQNGRLTVVDATNVQVEGRRSLLALASAAGVKAFAILLNLSEKECMERNLSRPGRIVPEHVIQTQARNLRESLPGMKAEGFSEVYELTSTEQIDSAVLQRRLIERNP